MAQTRQADAVLVFDNSTRDMHNRDWCEGQGWTYLGGTGNQGLSRAYNQAVEACKDRQGYLCLLDDDTHLPEHFLENMEKGIEKKPGADIYIPILTQEGRIISPCRREVPKSKLFFASAQEVLGENPEAMQAFNSCMTVSLAVFRDYRYDERIFLDGVDHAFLRDMRSRGKKLQVLPVTCEHGFSGYQKGSKAGDLTRFKIYAKDSRVLYEDTPGAYGRIVGRRALHLCLRHKSLAFLKEFFQN